MFSTRRSAYPSSLSEFQDLLNDESSVNIEGLRDAASSGVPEEVRVEVWKILLGVSKTDKSEELSHQKRLAEHYALLKQEKTIDTATMQLLRVDIERLRRQNRKQGTLFACFLTEQYGDFFQKHETRAQLENVIAIYLSSNCTVTYHSGLLELLIPFIYSAKVSNQSLQSTEGDVYFMFTATMNYLVTCQFMTRFSKGTPLAEFLMLFRHFEPELCVYLEDEGLAPNQWAIPWFKSLLSNALPLECLLRLWDHYFSRGLDFGLHSYVCLAILRNLSEDLMEMEHTDILSFLKNLPVQDMDQTLAHAVNMRAEVSASKLL